jgi:hypothetical protein
MILAREGKKIRHSKSIVRGSDSYSVRAVLIASVAVVLLLPSVAAALDPPDPLNVLFVANGWYDQEDDIEEHLLDLGCDVTVKKDYRVYGSTDLSVYDLIVITEFAPGLSYSALGNIESSEVPVLITEGFGELSVKLAKFGEGESAYVMLSNHPIVDWPQRAGMVAAAAVGTKNNPITDHSSDGFSRFDYTWEMGHVFFRWASGGSPWSWSEPEDTGTTGYGPYIIDAFTELTTEYLYPGDIHYAELWYTTSVWNGSNLPGAYGVYTTSSTHVIP